VPPEITIPSEDLVALVALIGLVVSVSQKVGFQVGPLVETPLAHRALVRRLLHVKYSMDRQSPGLAESFPTFCALERLLLGMDVPVVSKVILAAKRFPTNITGVRSFVRVCSLVDKQVVRLRELAIAELTNKLLLRPARSYHRTLQ